MAVLFAALLVLYFAVIRPLTAPEEEQPVHTDMLEGEALFSEFAQNFYVFEPIERAYIQSVEVKNEFGGYKIYRDASDTFQLDGFLGLKFNEELLSSLIVTAGSPTTMMRVAKDLDEEGFAEYGLDDPQASWTLTSTSGEKYTIYVGDKLVTDAGYYVKYEPRNAVYILSTTLEDTILKPAHSLLKPLLTAGMSSNDYFTVQNFTIWHGEDIFVNVEKIPDAEKKDPDKIVEIKMTQPVPETSGEQALYEINETLYFDVLYKLMALEGTEVLAFKPEDDQLAEYGLSDPAYAVRYVFNDYEFVLFISEMQPDGTYNAVSSLYGYSMVCKVPAENLIWLEAGKFDWLLSTPFFVNIVEIEQIKLKGDDINADFYLKHGTDDSGAATLEVTDSVSGTVIPNKDVKNFRQYYKSMLNITNQEYVTLSAEDKAALMESEDEVMLTMYYKKTNGEEFEFKFYRYVELSTGHISGGKIFVTVNGVGEFYTSNDLIQKLIDDCPRVLAGLDVDPYIQY